MVLHGGCLCGQVRYEISGPVTSASHCHCTFCRKAHGAAFATYATVDAEQHRFLSGEALVRRFASSPTVVRCFCDRCGSPLTWQDADRFPGRISFPLAGLDVAPEPLEQHHIFVGSRACWFTIHDSWPQRFEY